MGQELGVRTLLEGSVRKSGNMVRITAQLINAKDGYHLWSETYDRELDEVFAVQDEIARAITETLKIELFIEEQERLSRGGTHNAQAYDLYLRGMAFLRLRAPDSVDGSAELLQQALELDPNFALALDALGYGYLLKTYSGEMSIEDATREALPLIERALEIQPDLEQAHASLGLLKSRSGLYDESEAHFRTALDINPNYFQGQVNFGLTLVYQSRLKEASAAYLRALALDPLNANLNFNLGALMMLLGQFDDGIEFIDRSLTIDPGRQTVRGAKTHWLAQYGHLAEAVQNGRSTLEAYPEFAPNIAALVNAYLYLGMIDEAKVLLENAEQQLPDNMSIRRARWEFSLTTGDDAAFIALAEEDFRQLDRTVSDPLNVDQRQTARQYGLALLLQGRNEEAAEFLYWAAGGEEGIATTTYDHMGVLKLLALSYQGLVRETEASLLLDRCLELALKARDSGWATPILHVRLAEILVQKGQIDEAIDHVTIAIDKGYRDLGWLEYGIFWRQLQDHPQLNGLMVRIYEDIEAQREVLRQAGSQVAHVQLQ
jgi:tetratricopeptide (TPR) repeat protein